MNTRTDLCGFLFDIVNNKNPIPEAKLIEKIKSLIQGVMQLNVINQQEIALFQEIKLANPELNAAQIDGMDVNFQSDLNRLLVVAIFNKQKEVVQLILEAKANPDEKSSILDMTPLILAASNGHEDIAGLLLEAKANLEFICSRKTALDVAIEAQKLSTVKLFLTQNAVIRYPESLYNFLQSCDQRDPNVLVCFENLCQQLKNKYLKPDFSSLLSKATAYLQKLKKLTDIHRKKCFTAIDEATEAHMNPNVVNLITTFDEPLQGSRIGFFKPEEIDLVLASSKEVKKGKSTCARLTSALISTCKKKQGV
ncbi:MAG: ankyrin repeat domain-containing protein [Gammaproteobacteria bacterium]